MADHHFRHRQTMNEDLSSLLDSLGYQAPAEDPLTKLLKRVDRSQLARLSGASLERVNQLFAGSEECDVRKLDIELPGGVALRNVNTADDVGRALDILKALNLTPESLAQLMVTSKVDNGSATGVVNVTATPAESRQLNSEVEQGGMTLQEMVARYATRKRNTLAAKSLYEYGNYQRKFVAWMETRKNSRHIPIRNVARADVALFIEDLQE